ncbi:adenylyl-sulfate kinase [Brevundimonas guildfordensis]|uniref:Adenylyl-sulfate kinase n=1 Tax=Brevundimonas guildfordensis TaxID=2762241 RepID=A0ABR8R0K0_9CAUL|nr:adenylyl-sulfate kinase [Brevundimonas guildfordensis]MBD7941325.1 adenylyl-sulfate kinase [Brevundimonas guildfordensis]
MSAPSPQRDLLRFITCGSVDDGKSTLIGRLLHDVGAVPDDQIAALTDADGALDFSLLVDGLLAEREQGITIDVAYRYFSTERRSFIVADTPGHEQYTRNMATGASTADAAIILADARKGVLTQTRRHAHILALMGVRRVVLAVTKMDLVDWSQAVFESIAAEFAAYAARIGLEVTAIPVSGATGANVARRGEDGGWYAGPTLLKTLEGLPPLSEGHLPFRMAVQGVIRPNLDFRGYTGRIAAGRVGPGDAVRALPSGVTTTVARVLAPTEDAEQASAGQSVVLTLTDEIDLSRGDVLCAAAAPLEVADQFEAAVIWMADAALLPGRQYDLKLGARTVAASITDIRHKVNVNTLEPLAARTLELNDIGVCHLSLGADIAFAPYEEDREMGGFILIDRMSQATVGAGMIRFALRRAHNIHRQPIKVDRARRAALKGQQPAVLWFTGLSGAGKSTIANLVEEQLAAEGRHTYLIDGDNLRHGLSRDLGFTEADRVENIRRAAEAARMMADAGLIVLVSLISPFRAERAMAREMMGDVPFLEIFVDAPLATVEARDVKGLYAKARRGELHNFTGIDSPYEAPENAEIHVQTEKNTAEEAASVILDVFLNASGRPSGARPR